MPKPIQSLLLALLFSAALSTVSISLVSLNQAEGLHPKNTLRHSEIFQIMAPGITPPANITVNTTNTTCNANVTVPPLSVTPDPLCQDPDITITNSFNGTSNASGVYPLGSTSVTWTVTDDCGGTSTVTQTITVVDNVPPNLTCAQVKVVALNNNPPNALSAAEFLANPTTSVTDNCGGPVILQARRILPACGIPTSNQFSSFVTFCCDDVAGTNNIMVEVRATDPRNNSITCMVTVDVQDNMAPVISESLPDITVSCAYTFNVNNLSIFGDYVLVGNTRNTYTIADPEFPASPTVFQDGVFTTNCPGVTIQRTQTINLPMCNTGTITRTFTFTDQFGNVNTDQQIITIEDFNKFNIEDIDWPNQDVEFPQCNVDIPNPDITGRPVLNNDKCSMAAATFQDQTFDHGTYCKVIRRNWTVIDWCHYVPNQTGSNARWTFVQYIYITNDVPPVISPRSCRDTLICAPFADCLGRVQFQATGTDDCLPVRIDWSYKIDLENNEGIDVTGSGNEVDLTVASGTHRMVWEAHDHCGNISTCSFLFTVRECKAPTIIVKNGLSANLTPMDINGDGIADTGMTTIKASDFNNGSFDNCTPAENLIFSFSSNTTQQTRTFNCTQRGRRNVTIFATDAAGNQSQTTTFIDIQDNSNICAGFRNINIAGHIQTENEIRLPDTKVMISGAPEMFIQKTDQEGKFVFEKLETMRDYEIEAERDTLHMMGVSTLDLVLIQRHLLGIDSLDSPYKLIAADIDCSQNINSLDILRLRKLLLGVDQAFPHHKSWSFIPSSVQFDDPNHPWPYQHKIMLKEILESEENLNLIAVKLGDVNGSISSLMKQDKVSQRTLGLKLKIEDISVKKDQIIEVPVFSDRKTTLFGLQGELILHYGLELASIDGHQLNIEENQSALLNSGENHLLRFATEQTEVLEIGTEQPLFVLHFRVKKDGKLKDFIATAEVAGLDNMIVTESFEEKGWVIEMRKNSNEPPAIINQNHPNPFINTTNIEVVVPTDGTAQVSIFDATGKTLHRGTVNLQSGSNQITISDSQLGGAKGVLYCKIKGKDFNEVLKLYRIE